jgi:hypothetical protein
MSSSTLANSQISILVSISDLLVDIYLASRSTGSNLAKPSPQLPYRDVDSLRHIFRLGECLSLTFEASSGQMLFPKSHTNDNVLGIYIFQVIEHSLAHSRRLLMDSGSPSLEWSKQWPIVLIVWLRPQE